MRGLNFSGQGNVGSEPELKTIPGSNTMLAEVSIAFNRSYKKGDKWENTTAWAHVRFWGKLAELVSKNVHKGSCICVDGRIDQEEWSDKETGKKRTKLVFVANDFHLVEAFAKINDNQPVEPSKAKQPEQPSVATPPINQLVENNDPPPNNNEDIPF